VILRHARENSASVLTTRLQTSRCVRHHSNEWIKLPSIGSEHARNAVTDQNIV